MSQGNQSNEVLRQSLIRVAQGLNDIAGSLLDKERESCAGVISTLNRSVIPQLSSDCPLLVAVTGGGGTGKSTIFNFLAGAKVSASDPRAGYTRRMVAAIHPKVAADKQKMELLFERFRANSRPRALTSPEEALEPGDPVYVECPSIPEHLVLVDTPDFDTGTKEGFTNRDAAREILDVADVVLYIATNATYNNKSATDFVRSVLSEIGVRKVALLYRFSPVYDDDMVREHMTVALSNLYPDKQTAKKACIGIWRIDESNEVAAGKCNPEIRPINGGASLADVLAALDPTKTRTDVMRGAIDESLRHADKWIQESETEALKYVAYRDSLKFLTSVESLECMKITPQREVLRLFLEEWEHAQPKFVRYGHCLSRTTLKAARGVKGFVKGLVSKNQSLSTDNGPSFEETFRTEFLKSVQRLRKDMELHRVSFDFPKKDPDMRHLFEALETLCKKFPDDYRLVDVNSKNYTAEVARPVDLDIDTDNGRSVDKWLDAVCAKAAAIVGETESLRPDVKNLVRSIREKMTLLQKAKEWSWASLDSLAVLGSLCYVVATGDAFTGGTLMSMFGLNDLVAIPALGTFFGGHGKIDEKNVQEQMKRLFTIWAEGKTNQIRPILEEEISGRDIAACDKTAKRLEGALGGLKSALADAHQQVGVVFDN